MASSKQFSLALGRAMVLALMGATTLVGCRSSQQTSMSNPFLSADRVPAPGSRIPAPGAAQPYYQGQAAPGMQAVPQAQPMQPLGALPPSDDITPIPADGSLVNAAQPPTAALAASDSAVRIPSDESEMRFTAPPLQPAAQPTPQPVVATQPVSTPQPVAVAANPTPVATTPTVFRDNQPPPTAPVINNWPPQTNPAPQVTLTPVSNSDQTGLFRDPAVGVQPQPLLHESTAQPMTAPRARIPGSAEMIREEVVPGAINTTSYQVGMAGGGQGDPLMIPPPGYVPQSFETAAPTTPASDAFVPRGTSRDRSPSGFGESSVPTIRVTPG